MLWTPDDDDCIDEFCITNDDFCISKDELCQVTPEGSYGFLTDPKIPWVTCLTMGDSWAFT